MMYVKALTFFWDEEIGDRRGEGEEWTTDDHRAAKLERRGLIQIVERRRGPPSDKHQQASIVRLLDRRG